MYPDIYYEKKYSVLNENIISGKTNIIEIKEEYGYVYYVFLLRKIDKKLNGKTYYDIITPYGYGGPIIEYKDEYSKKKLIDHFYSSLRGFCDEHNVVTEFIRFHPLFNYHNDFKAIYDIDFSRKTLGTNLKKFDSPVNNEFSKSARKIINSSIEMGMDFIIEERPNKIKDFYNIYYDTMNRNEADDFYYFNKNYFKKLIKYFRNNIIYIKIFYNDKLIAMGLYFVYGKYMHAHLSGTYKEYLKFSPAYLIRYAATVWGKENGFEMIHHGGGRSNNINDGLYQFKKRFAKNTEFNYMVGKKIWNKEIYDKLVKEFNIKKDSDFFPLYRER